MYNQIPGTEAAAFKPRKPIVVLRQIGNLVYTSGHGRLPSHEGSGLK